MRITNEEDAIILTEDEFEQFQKELVEHSIDVNEKLKELLSRKKSWENSDVR